MKKLPYLLLPILLVSCNPKVSINSGKNDRVTEQLLTGQGNEAFQVTYEETVEDRRLRYELLETIRGYVAVMPEVEEKVVYEVTFKEPKNVSFFMGEEECRYAYTKEVILEKVTAIDVDTMSYTLLKKSTPEIETIEFKSDDEELKSRCNIEIDKLTITTEANINLLNHILEKKNVAEQKLAQFADMCRYGGVFKDGGSCLVHRIEVEKFIVDGMIHYLINSDIEGQTDRTSYSWGFTTGKPYFSLGFEYKLRGQTPDFETLDPHYYYNIQVLDYN